MIEPPNRIVSAVGKATSHKNFDDLFVYKRTARDRVRYQAQWLYARFLFGRGAPWRFVPLWAKQLAILLNDRTGNRITVFAGASIGDVMENDLLKLLFCATTIANVAINASSSPITSVHVSLHTGNPNETGDQTTSEATYTGYARVPVTRDASNWTVTANSVSPAAAINFTIGSAGCFIRTV